MKRNYLPSLEEHLMQRPMCHRKIMFSRGRFSKCKALGKVALESLWDLGERDNYMREGCPFSQARCQHGQEENTASPTGLITELRGQEAPPDNHQCPNPARSLTALLVNTIVLFWLFYLEACIPVTAVELENKGLKASTSLLLLPLCLRMSVEQWRAGSPAPELYFDVGFCCWLLT